MRLMLRRIAQAVIALRNMSSMPHVAFVVFCCLILLLSDPVHSVGQHRRFEYKLSFKGPHLVQRDGTIPFWEHGGHAIASDESIRITPSLRSKKGHVWTKEKTDMDHWEVEVVFRVSGRGRIGADGLALWFTTDKGEGPVFGGPDKWNGLGVFFDSFDNDGQHNNPYIMAMVNDGTKSYDHNSDGATQQLGGCLRDFRNKPYNVKVKIEYYQKALTVMFHNGMTQNKDDYELCLRAEGVQLPREGYFGMSAATGGLADDHDVQTFLTHSLQPPTEQPAAGQVPDDERKKFEDEFDEYYKKLESAKDQYQKDHPDQAPKYDLDDEKWYESQDIRELKMIYEGQSAIHNTIRELTRKLDEIIGRQERTLSSISMIGQANQGGGHQPSGGGVPQLPNIDTIKRHEVDSVLNNQRELQNHVREIRSLVNDIQSKGGAAGGEGAPQIQDLKNNLNNLHTDVKTLVNRPAASTGGCPTYDPPNCLTPFYFFLLMGTQIALFFGYMVYKSNKEAAAKKFY